MSSRFSIYRQVVSDERLAISSLSLIAGEDDTRDTEHESEVMRGRSAQPFAAAGGKKLSALPLLMLRIFTHDPAYTLAFPIAPNHEAALLTDRCAGWTNFHGADGGGGDAAGAEVCMGVEPVVSGVEPLRPSVGGEGDVPVIADVDAGPGAGC